MFSAVARPHSQTAVAVSFVNIKGKLFAFNKVITIGENDQCLEPETAEISPSAVRYHRIIEARFIVSPSWEISVGKKEEILQLCFNTNGVLQSLYEEVESR